MRKDGLNSRITGEFFASRQLWSSLSLGALFGRWSVSKHMLAKGSWFRWRQLEGAVACYLVAQLFWCGAFRCVLMRSRKEVQLATVMEATGTSLAGGNCGLQQGGSAW